MNDAATHVSDPQVDALVGRVADEFLERLTSGEQPSVEEYARRHPQLAGVLRQVLPALRLMRLSGAGGASGDWPPGEGPKAGRRLGDFRVVGEIGRGGMGVVYEAEQVSLGRRVALKVLPHAATLDARQLQRFKNEAQAAALLQHPHIVPVLAVGCEGGVHYYAMQYIEGQSLADLIQATRSDDRTGSAEPSTGPPAGDDGRDAEALVASQAAPAPPTKSQSAGGASGRAYFREAARLLLQAAEALAHAHQQGVIHRDVKPANLLLDRRGDLWVTDFGLARLQGDAGVTATGDLVGTLRYMSPEQALAKRVPIDHRADVYSLGATAFELLTLEPAYPESDRQELLRRIAFGEPRRPRRVNPAVPADLEAVVLKAMEKSPDDRYANAEEFAEDLRRYLADEPVRAKRPTPLKVAAQWARRHMPVVLTAAVAGATVLAVLAVAVVLLTVKNAQTDKALAQANSQKERADQGEARAKNEADQAFKIALSAGDAVHEIIPDLVEKRVIMDPDYARKAERVLDKAVDVSEHLARPEAPSEVLFKACWGLCNAGDNYRKLGIDKKGQKTLERAVELGEQLVARSSGKTDYSFVFSARFVLAQSYRRLGDLHRELGRSQQARDLYRQSLAVWHRSPDFGMKCPYEGPFSYIGLGDLDWAAGNLLGAVKFYRDAINLRRTSPAVTGEKKEPSFCEELAGWHKGLGLLLERVGRPSDAGTEYENACKLLRELRAEYKNQPDLGAQLLAECDRQHARLSEEAAAEAAAALYHEALGLLKLLAERYPGETKYRLWLADTHWRLGNLATAGGRPKEAGPHFREALDLMTKLAADIPDGGPGPGAPGNHDNDLAWFLANCPDPQLADPARAVKLARKAVEKAPDHGYYWNTLGAALYRTGDLKEALKALEKSNKLNHDSEPDDWLFLAMTHHRLGNREEARKYYGKAAAWARQRKTVGLELARLRAEAAKGLGVALTPDPPPPAAPDDPGPPGKSAAQSFEENGSGAAGAVAAPAAPPAPGTPVAIPAAQRIDPTPTTAPTVRRPVPRGAPVSAPRGRTLPID